MLDDLVCPHVSGDSMGGTRPGEGTPMREKGAEEGTPLTSPNGCGAKTPVTEDLPMNS